MDGLQLKYRNGIQISKLVGGFLFLVLIAFGLKILLTIPVVRGLFILQNLPALEQDTSIQLLFVLGVLTSFHCLGMCGGIALSQVLRNNTASSERCKTAWLFPSLLYNSGRVIAYTLVGGIVGGLGQAISFTGIWKSVIPMFGGVFMIIMGVNLLGIFPVLRRLVPQMPYFVVKKLQGEHHYGPFLIGLLSGLMPCGPLQIVQLYALGTGSIIRGALALFVFALGTVPLLFALGTLSSLINKKQTALILKISAILVVVLGFVMVGRGLALAGVVMRPATSYFVAKGTDIAVINGKEQTVASVLKSDSFPPLVVQKGLPFRWIIKAEAGNLNGCNNALTIPQYKINKNLVVGNNVIHFTPRQTGEIGYTCWMGMIKSKITVVEDLKQVKVK